MVRVTAVAFFLAVVSVGWAQEEKKHFDPAVHEATRTFTFEEFLIVPVRIHILQSKEDDALQCRLKPEDVDRIFGKVNRIWNKAGIALRMESVLKETAVVPKDFNGMIAALHEFKGTRPEESLGDDLLHVYYIHRLPTNGVYQGCDAIFVKDAASLREVKGGVDEPIPRVTSHEIGHAMGLQHRQDTINLMASGTTGWSLNNDEIDRVRAWARKQDWVIAPAKALELKHYALLAALPGDSPVKEKARAALQSSR